MSPSPHGCNRQFLLVLGELIVTRDTAPDLDSTGKTSRVFVKIRIAVIAWRLKFINDAQLARSADPLRKEYWRALPAGLTRRQGRTELIETNLPGAVLIEPRVFDDDRASSLRAGKRRLFTRLGSTFGSSRTTTVDHPRRCADCTIRSPIRKGGSCVWSRELPSRWPSTFEGPLRLLEKWTGALLPAANKRML